MYCKSPREGRPVFITSISKKMTNNFGNVEENPYLCPIKKTCQISSKQHISSQVTIPFREAERTLLTLGHENHSSA